MDGVATGERARRPSARPGVPARSLGALIVRVSLLPPVAAALLYLVFLLRFLRQLIVGAFWNGDVASIPLLAGDIAHRAGGIARISLASYSSSFLFDLATRWLPLHRLVWEGLSLGASLVGIALMAWAASRAAGKPAGVLTAAIAVSASPVVLYAFVALRGPTWLGVGLMAAGLVALADPPAWLGSPRARWTLIAILGVIAGVSLASDPLFAPTGIVPFAAAAGIGWLLWGAAARRLAWSAAAVVGIAAVAAELTTKVMGALGFRLVPTMPIRPAALGRIPTNLSYFAHDVLAFGNAEFPRPPAGVVSVPGLVTVLLCVGAVAAAIRFAPRLRRLEVPPSAPAMALGLLVAYWVLVAAFDTASFVLSNLPVAGVGTARYVVPVFLAIAALGGLWGAGLGWRRVGMAAVATALTVLSAAGMVQLVDSYKGALVVNDGPKVLALVRSEGIDKGYGGYWDAIGLSWRNDSGVGVYPVEECAPDGTRALCQFGVNTLTTWYRPVARARSFLLVAPSQIPLSVGSPPPPSLGPPAEVHTVGVYTVYVYGYDIGSRLAAPPPPPPNPTGS